MSVLQENPSSGSGLLAIFCDLTTEDQLEFYPWLTEEMFPARRNIGFKSCASFRLIDGHGSEFLTLYEVPNVGYLYDKPYQQLRENRSVKDRSYHKKFINPKRYILSWVGPEKNNGTYGFSEYLNINRFDVLNKHNELFNSYFITRYLPTVINDNELISIRRYVSIEGEHKNFVIEEYDEKNNLSNSVLGSNELFSENRITSKYKRIIQSK